MKAVIILEPNQPLGLLVNTASVLSVTLGDVVESIRGVDTYDADGVRHPGVIRIPPQKRLLYSCVHHVASR